jgi:thioredoxin-like negative regulator of GroEL
MSTAREKVEEFLTKHYSYMEAIDMIPEEKQDLLSHYNAEHWKKATVKELAEELHQIIWDSENDPTVMLQIAELLVSAKDLEGGQDIWNAFRTTTEHSH